MWSYPRDRIWKWPAAGNFCQNDPNITWWDLNGGQWSMGCMGGWSEDVIILVETDRNTQWHMKYWTASHTNDHDISWSRAINNDNCHILLWIKLWHPWKCWNGTEQWLVFVSYFYFDCSFVYKSICILSLLYLTLVKLRVRQLSSLGILVGGTNTNPQQGNETVNFLSMKWARSCKINQLNWMNA